MQTTDVPQGLSVSQGRPLGRAHLPDFYTRNRSPLFRVGIRRMRWLHDQPQSRMLYLQRLTLIIFAVALVLTWICSLVLPAGAFLVAGLVLILCSLIGAVLSDLMPILSFEYFYKLDGVQLDLLRLTQLTRRSIVLAYHELAKVDHWRAMMAIIGLRVGAVILLLIGIFLDLSANPRYGSRLSGSFGEFVFTVIVIGAITVVFILEPRWRLRVTAALGLALTVRISQQWARILISVMAVILLWILLLVYLSFVSMLGVLFSFSAMCPFILPVAICILLRGIYSLIENWGLMQAEHYLFCEHYEA